jgi:hypothetical protein
MVILCVVSLLVLVIVCIYILAVICDFLMTCLKEHGIWGMLHLKLEKPIGDT